MREEGGGSAAPSACSLLVDSLYSYHGGHQPEPRLLPLGVQQKVRVGDGSAADTASTRGGCRVASRYSPGSLTTRSWRCDEEMRGAVVPCATLILCSRFQYQD